MDKKEYMRQKNFEGYKLVEYKEQYNCIHAGIQKGKIYIAFQIDLEHNHGFMFYREFKKRWSRLKTVSDTYDINLIKKWLNIINKVKEANKK